MNEIYRQAFSEIDEILKIMPLNLLEKIPTKFKEMIKEEKSIEYKPEIKEPLENYQLKEETIIILALIYRNFLCDKEKKEELKLRDAQRIKEAEEAIRQKYNPDDVFKNKRTEDTINEKNSEEKSLVVLQEEKWYKKIFNIIKKLFRRND